MNISRRFFIGGAASFGAFAGNRVVRAAGNALAGTPNITFGVVSDIHITKVGEGEKMEAWGNNLTFRHTLEWFRDQGVDAVLIAGDMADNGMVEQMEAVAQAWYAVTWPTTAWSSRWRPSRRRGTPCFPATSTQTGVRSRRCS